MVYGAELFYPNGDLRFSTTWIAGNFYQSGLVTRVDANDPLIEISGIDEFDYNYQCYVEKEGGGQSDLASYYVVQNVGIRISGLALGESARYVIIISG